MLMYIDSVNNGKLFSPEESFQSDRINLGKHVKQFEDGVNIGKTIRVTKYRSVAVLCTQDVKESISFSVAQILVTTIHAKKCRRKERTTFCMHTERDIVCIKLVHRSCKHYHNNI